VILLTSASFIAWDDRQNNHNQQLVEMWSLRLPAQAGLKS
jgi:hypothetical protein